MSHIRTLVCAAVAALLLSSVPSAEALGSDPRDLLAYTWANAGFTDEEIALIGVDGSDNAILTAERGFSLAAAWSPDGRRIAFTSNRSAPPGTQEPLLYSELYVMDADGSHVRRITRNVGLIDFQPAWSPDGRQIVVARGPGIKPPPGQLAQPTDLWIIDLASGRERQLTDSPGTWEWFADWSPDGRRIAFDGDQADPGNNDVYTIRTDATDLQRLTSGPALDADPRYSPDGQQVTFDSDRAGNPDIFVMRDNGTQVRQLTNDPGTDFAPAFSPDGRVISFSSDRDDGRSDIFLMRSDGSQQMNLTHTPSQYEFDAEWQPR